MKVSHMILKVNDLQKAVEEYREKGFSVEYGSAKRAYNAIIYFSDGPYLELLASTGMPEMMKRLLCLSGKKKFADRLDLWDTHEGGPCGLALETYESNLEREKSFWIRQSRSMLSCPLTEMTPRAASSALPACSPTICRFLF